jgi:O-Antigen ligase
MMLVAQRLPLLTAGVLLSAALSGVLIARSGPVGALMLAALVFGAFVAVVAEAPIVGVFALACTLGLAPELTRDDRLIGATPFVYGQLFSGVTPQTVLLALVAAVLAFGLDTSRQWWPGAPATLAVALLVVALANVIWFSPLLQGLFVVRPLFILVLAILVGYWASLRYGTRLPLIALVVAGMAAIPGGLYNAAAGDLSYYDASFVYVIGMAAIVVFFRVVDVGILRVPFLVLSVLVIGLSLRRGATIAVAVAFLVAALFFSRGTVRRAIALALAALIVTELAVPDLAISRLETLADYFSGSSGARSVDARDWESANAWVNIRKHWFTGIGPTANWTLYDTSGGLFKPAEDVRNYLHDSYQWVWLRYSLIGLIAYIAFLAGTARALLRRGAPTVTVIVGGSIAGTAIAVVTASFLTTTTRWPLAVGLYLGVALAALHAQRSDQIPADTS